MVTQNCPYLQSQRIQLLVSVGTRHACDTKIDMQETTQNINQSLKLLKENKDSMIFDAWFKSLLRASFVQIDPVAWAVLLVVTFLFSKGKDCGGNKISWYFILP